MNKKILSAVLAFILLFLCGCQLAVPNAGPEAAGQDVFSNHYLDQMNNGSPESDRLAGVFITREYLNTQPVDFEEYLKNHPGNLSGEILVPDEAAAVRIYAEKGEAGYDFPYLEGIMIASFRMQSDPNDPESTFWGSASGEGASDIHNAYKVTDEGHEVSIQATLYLPRVLGDVNFYFNPVYQTAAGDVYLLPGTGLGYNTTNGGSLNQTIREQVTFTENGEQVLYSTNLDVSIVDIDLPKSVTLIQMDAEHQVLTMDTYKPGLLPEEITPRIDATYILVEENYADDVVTSVNAPGSDPISAFYRLDSDLCVLDYIRVNWPGQE